MIREVLQQCITHVYYFANIVTKIRRDCLILCGLKSQLNI